MENINVFAGAIDFGMGPVGKLSAIVKISSNIKWFGCGQQITNQIFVDNPFVDVCWSRKPKELKAFAEHHHIEAAVIVLDPKLAVTLESIGVKVLYIDSLIFLWTEADFIPIDVSVYCAQLCPELPYTCWDSIKSIKCLKWIGGIIPPQTKFQLKASQSNVVVNFGGVHSPIGSEFGYIDVVLPPLIQSLSQSEFQKITITGSPEAVEYINENYMYSSGTTLFPIKHIRSVSLTHHEFINEIANSELFITSPGLTVLLETCELNIPTLILPPQNWSQYKNSAMYEKYTEGISVISWSQKSLQIEELNLLIEFGEVRLVEEIYYKIKELIGNKSVFNYLEHEILDSIKILKNVKKHSLYPEIIGMNGAFEVFQYLHKYCLATDTFF